MTMPKFKQDDSKSYTTNGGDSFDEPPRRGVPKALKWMAGTAVGLVILAGIGGVVATQLIDQQKYKSLIVSKVEDATGYTLDWDGNISIGMMPLPHASISKLTVKSGDVQILSVAKADIQVALAPLLSKKVEIKDITIDEPVVTLLTTKAGIQTWTPKAAKAAPANEAATEEGASAEAPMDVVVNRIAINGGSLVIDNQQSGSRQELKNLNVKVRADSLKGPFDVNANTEWSGQKIEVKATSGEVNISEASYPIQARVGIPGAGIDLSFSGVVDAQNMGAKGDVSLDVDDVAKAAKSMTGTAPSLPDGIGGKAELSSKIVYSSSRVAMDDMALSLGALSYSGAVSANGLGGETPPQLSFQLQPKSKAAGNAPALVQLLSDLTIAVKGSVENEKIQITTANIKTMGNNISMNGYSTMGANPTVDLSINASEINLDALTQVAGTTADTKTASAAPAKAGNMGFAMPFAGRVRADIAKLTTGGKTYSNIKADVDSSAGGLTIHTADVAIASDTNVNVSGKIADTSNLSGLNLKVAAKTQDTEKLFSTFGIAMPELPRKVGAASVNGHFTGDLKNLGFAAAVSALQFNVKGEGTVGDPLGTPAISSLKFNINHPNFNDAMKLVQPGFAGSTGFFGPLDLSGELALGTDKVEIKGLTGKLGQTTVDGQVAAVTKPKTKLSGALNFGSIIFPSATNNGGTVAATSQQSAAAASKGDRWSRDPIDTAWMKSFDADISVKAKNVTQNMWKLNDANIAFKLNDGTLTLDDVSAGMFGGRASINGVVKSGAGDKDPLSISAKMNASNVNAQELMSAAMGKVSYVLSGTLSKVDVSVNATGASVANLVQTLGGAGTLNGKDITVTGVDIVELSNAAGGSYKPLERLGALSKSVGASNQTKFDTFDSEFAIENGVVNLKKTMFDNADASMNSTGSVNLPAWTLNITNKLVLKSNEAKPITFTLNGSIDNPAQSGLQGILMNRVETLINKEGTTLNKALGKFLGTNKEAAAPADTTTVPADAAPAASSTEGAADAPAVAPAPAKTDKEKAVEEGVKAIQGLFGR